MNTLKKALEKADAEFVTQAIDESQRRMAIERLSNLRRLHLMGAVFTTAAFMLVFTLGAFHPALGAVGGAIGLGFMGAMQWVNVLRSERDLRMMMLVERLRTIP